MQIFRYDSPLMSVLMKVANCIFLSFLWLVCSLPVITAGASAAALYHTVQKVVRDERGYVAAEFFRSLRMNLRQSVPLTLAGLLVAAIFLSDYWILEEAARAGYGYGNASVFFQMLLVFEAVYLVYVFACMARFQNRISQILKNSLILAIRHMGTSIWICVILLFGGVLICLIPLTVLILPVVMAWFIGFFLEKLFEKQINIEHCDAV